MPPEAAGSAQRKSGWLRVFFFIFLLAVVIAGLLFQNWLVIPFAATLGLTLSCMIYVFLWRPPPGASTREVMMVYVFFGFGALITGLASLFSGCAMIFMQGG